MARPTLPEQFARERDPEIPDTDLSITSRVRRLLFAGAVLTAFDVADLGASKGLLAQVVADLRKLNFEVVQTPNDDGITAYSLGNPDHTPTEAELDAYRASKETKKHRRVPSKAVARVAPKAAPKAPEPEPDLTPLVLPELMAKLSVYALVVNDDDSITIGIRNGTRKWTANLTGVIET